MTCGIQMGSGAMIYTPSFIKIGSGFQNPIGVNTQGERMEIA
jgi:hypothetical protein